MEAIARPSPAIPAERWLGTNSLTIAEAIIAIPVHLYVEIPGSNSMTIVFPLPLFMSHL
jgi:hypothetical protein